MERHLPTHTFARTMSMMMCIHCKERVFTIVGWADVDHCPECGRVLTPGAIQRRVHEQVVREVRRFDRGERTTEKNSP
jgi:hypothetical protein